MPTWKYQVDIKNVESIAETADAVLCEIDGDEYWIPKSQISDDSEIWEKDQTGTLIINEWLAEQKGLA